MLKALLIGLGVGVSILVGYILYNYFSQDVPQPLPLEREEMVKEALSKASDAVAACIKSGRLLLLPIRGDGTGRITYLLREQLIRSGRYSIVEMKEDEGEGVAKVLKTAVEKLLGADEVSSLRKSHNADVALLADIETFDETDEKIDFKMSLYIEDEKGRSKAGEVRDSLRKSLLSARYFSLWMRSSSALLRLLIHTLFVVLLPLSLWKIALRVFESESNLNTALFLIALTVVDILVCFVMLGLTLATTIVTILFILNIPFSLFYNFVALSWIEHMRK
ncbi:MAG: hypothetical protein N2234_08415 [Planctomycetota bacterium]|nr:hypothetical protein [Planctomycetota bacterium]